MRSTHNFVAIDLGASSGRVILGRWDGERFDLQELHRFVNQPIKQHGSLYWNVGQLWDEIKAGLRAYATLQKSDLSGIGIDSWAVDYALLDEAGQLLGNPHHYRDQRTAGVPEQLDQIISAQRLYDITGIQRLPINTLYQLVSMQLSHDPQLGEATSFLMIPDLFHYWMTGQKVAEYTNATTTQFFNARERRWSTELLQELQLPTNILPPVVRPGTLLGNLLPIVRLEVGLRHEAPVIVTATHDTASAVAAIPGLDQRSAYISSGTWSLVGVELDEPVLSAQARQLNFTNEGGVNGTIRFLKNVAGLWLLQECQRQWQQEGQNLSWPELVTLAEQAQPLVSLVDPDAPDFLNPGDMPAALRAYCRRTSQPEPETIGALVRCCLESLALKYRWVIQALEQLTGRQIDTIRVVGGGSQNALLCQLSADACGRRIVAGPVEATALGNILVQAVTCGLLPGIAAGREAIARSVEQRVYEPHTSQEWQEAMSRFEILMG